MNVCLIRPPTVLRLFSITISPSPPLGLSFIAAALRSAGHHVTILDAIAERPDQFTPFHDDIVTNGLSNEDILAKIPANTDVIGLTVMFTNNWLNDRKLINFLGNNLPSVPIIAGGEHITGMPEICMRQAHGLRACVLGEGEETVVELMEAFATGRDLREVEGIVFRENDQVITNPRRKRVREVGEIPRPAWDLFPLDIYRQYGLSYGIVHGELSLPIMATRGCPYRCTFCSSPQMWGTRYYMRKPQDVADEIEDLIKNYNATNFDFYDLTAIIKKDWIIEFAREILDRKLNITWQIPAGTRSEAIDAEVARYLYASGCRNITYAPESGSPEILQKIKKKVILPRMLESISHTYKEKMNVKLNMIIGFPEERHIDLWKTVWFLIQASWYGVNDIFPSVLVPYTGCELFDQLVKEKKIDPDSDDYYYRIIAGDSFFGSYFYNDHISATALKTYRLFYLFVFYSTNFLFHPSRIYRTIRNLITGKVESRGEQRLHEVIKRNLSRDKAKQTMIMKEAV